MDAPLPVYLESGLVCSLLGHKAKLNQAKLFTKKFFLTSLKGDVKDEETMGDSGLILFCHGSLKTKFLM